MKTKVVFSVILIMLMLVLSAGSLNLFTNTGFSESRRLLMMRNVGHQLLRSSGDSTSRVMPVRKLDEETFLIEFENDFMFSPDSLVNVVRRTLSGSEFPGVYTVDVIRCMDQMIIYGYEMSARTSIIPCRGRVQPSGCYAVQITFQKQSKVYDNTFLTGFAIAGMALLGFVVFGVKNNRRKEPVKEPIIENGIFIPLGAYKFYTETGLLIHAAETLELSRKETMLLKLFVEHRNQLLTRDMLLKEIWESEGVITGRSLDMFVSKLRKKLRHDPTIGIVNVHGKGYRLEV
jgi:Transcriptional regulatory protein, C terminal